MTRKSVKEKLKAAPGSSMSARKAEVNLDGLADGHHRLSGQFVGGRAKAYLTAVCHGGTRYGVYLVNNSGETFKAVFTNGGGFQTLEDEVMPIGEPSRFYQNVDHGEAVLVSVYDEILDSDYVLMLSLSILKTSGETVTFDQVEKGGVWGGVVIDSNGVPTEEKRRKVIEAREARDERIRQIALKKMEERRKAREEASQGEENDKE